MTWHIFAGGELPDSSFIRIEIGDEIICADRGLVHAKKLGIAPDLIIGDFDSYTEKLPEDTEIHRSIPEKDDTDTMLAVRTAIDRGAKKIKIYGAFGGRFDHTFANIQTLKFALEHGCEAELEASDNKVMLTERGVHVFERREDWYFSVFSYSEELKIRRMSGVKYSAENLTIRNNFPIGVSNEFTAERAEIEIESGTALIILSQKQIL